MINLGSSCMKYMLNFFLLTKYVLQYVTYRTHLHQIWIKSSNLNFEYFTNNILYNTLTKILKTCAKNRACILKFTSLKLGYCPIYFSCYAM